MKWKHLILVLCMALLVGAIYIAFASKQGENSSMNSVVHEFTYDEDSYNEINNDKDSNDEESNDEFPAENNKDEPKREFNETFKELKKLHEKNNDVYAWIEVPGTKIDYPILQHENDDEYYLYHDMDGDENTYGSIFTEPINSKDFKDPNTVIYGHNMMDESMFGSLKWFEDEEFFNKHSEVVITTLDSVRTYKILAAYRFSDDHLLKNEDILTQIGIKEYLNRIPEYVADAGGLIREDVQRKEPIITLSSCATGDNTFRLLVQAVLVTVKKYD